VNDRRRVLGWLSALLGACAAALAGLPVVGFLLAPLRLRHKGGAIDFDLTRIPADTFAKLQYEYTDNVGYVPMRRTVTLWARRQGDDVIAFSALCTHQNCNVAWDHAGRQFLCPCHDGAFAEDGSVARKPPTRPLQRLEASVHGDTVTIQIPDDFAG
jgi:menaquinol-cytochrome c reductase iron-sulfur subunit